MLLCATNALVVVNIAKYASSELPVHTLVADKIIVRRDTGGQVVFGISQVGTPAIYFFDDKNRQRMRLGLFGGRTASIDIYDEAGQATASFSVNEHDNNYIQLINSSRTAGVRVETGDNAKPSIKTMNGKETSTFP